MLVPLYGAGMGTDNKRHNAGEYDDAQHCVDATALTAAGLRGLRRQQAFDRNPIGPFGSEGESFEALEEEFAACAKFEFDDLTRVKRDPATWTSDKLAVGLADPQRFITDNKIGYPAHNVAPERRPSWWFNSGQLDFALLCDAQVRIDALHPGRVQP